MFSGLEVAHDPRRRWTALVSFTLQVATVAALLVLPIIYPRTLPEAFANRRIFLPTSFGDVHATATEGHAHGTGVTTTVPLVVNRTFIFHTNNSSSEQSEVGPPPSLNIGSPVGQPDILNPVVSQGVRPILHPTPPPANVRQSVIMEGNLLHRVEPQYPAPARALHIEGVVVLKAFIGRAGEIERLQVVEGHPFLARAAIDAVQQWKYRPYYLNGQPIEVETQITVKFMLNR